MKKFAYTVIAGAAIAGLAAPAAAAAPSGARIEALVGWDHPSIGLDEFGIDDSVDSDGIVFGLGAGYDLALGAGAALGVDVEGTLSTADFDFTDGADSAELSVGRDLYVGGRLTFPASDTANFYLKAGYTNARISATVTQGFDIFSDSANADGVRAGAGVQVALGGNAYVGGEYRYSNYEADLSRHQAVVTLGFRL